MKECRVLVISLPSSLDRRRQSERALNKLGISANFLDGVEGTALSSEEVSAVYDQQGNSREFKRPLSLPEIGCYLSHFKAWRMVSAMSGPVVILEDDFELSDDFGELFTGLQEIDFEGALVKLEGGNRLAKYLGQVGRTRFQLVHPFIAPPFTTGYVISPQAAASLVRYALPFTRPVDIDIKHWWEFGVQILAVRPHAVRPRENAAASSTVSAARAGAKSDSRGYRFWRNAAYQSRFLYFCCKAWMSRLSRNS